MTEKLSYEELFKKNKILEELLHEKEINESLMLEKIKKYEQIKKHYDALMQNTEDYILICDRNGVSQAFNAAYKERGEELLNMKIEPGMKPHKLSGIPEIVHYWDLLQERALKGEKFTEEYHDEERNLDFETIFFPVREGLEITGFTEITRNITKRKNIEKELQNSQNMYHALFTQMPVGCALQEVICDKNGKPIDYRILDINPVLEKTSGFISSEIKGRTILEIIPEDAAFWIDIYGQVALTGLATSFTYKQKTSPIQYAVTVYCLKEMQVVSIFQDITDREKAERELKERESFLNSIFDAIQDGIIVLDADLNILRVNKWMERMLPRTTSFVGEKCYKVYRKRDTPCERCPSIRAIEKGVPYRIKAPYPSEENPTSWIELSSFPLKDNMDKVVGIIEYRKDITKQKKAEDSLQKSEERYRTLVENTLDGYFIFDIPSGRIIFLNQRICDLFGYSMQEGLELEIWDVISPDNYEPVKKHIEDLASRKLSSFTSNLYDVIRKDNVKFKAEISTSLVTYKDKLAIQGVLRDVTEKERLNLQLQQAQKMDAVGKLAGGIAHDFNNLLMGIQGRTSLIKMEINQSDALYEYIKGIEDSVKSATDLTKRLLGFARGGKYEVKPIALNELIRNVSDMFGRTKKEISIYYKLQEGLWTIEADKTQIEQVLINIYVNAWQAMPGGGKLYINTENIKIGTDYVKPYSITPGNYVKISVTDTGHGMDEVTRQKIFDPFFTTKSMGHGTGLGLASAYGIIKNHNGIINVYSEKGKGTTLNICLPASEKEAFKEKELPEEIITGSETILLVDDEQTIIDVGKSMLERLGYKVITANSGHSAIQLYQERNIEIDIAILDMIMPEINGKETYRYLKKINPHIKVLLSSGYSINGQAQEILDNGCDGFIQKPFSLNELSKKMREILDK